MSVTADYSFFVKAVETVALGIDGVTNPDVEFSISGLQGRLTGSTTVPVTKSWKDQIQLSAGAATLDLTALANGNLPNVTFSGLKVQLVALFAAVLNTAAVVVDVGSSNGYYLFGDANGQVTIPAGGCAAFYCAEGLPDVGSGAKALAFSSSDVDSIIDVLLVAG